MYRLLTAVAIVSGLVLTASPAHATPDPIRGFTVVVKGDQIRATALVPGPAGRKAALQQRRDGRWVTVATSRTKRTATLPRARWRVAVDDLRVASSRAQAGPLAELIRLRAQAGKAKSKPKKVKVRIAFPVVPELVIGKVSGRQGQGEVELEWDGGVTYRYTGTADGPPEYAQYALDTAFLNWRLRGTDGGCTVSGTGNFNPPNLTGEGAVEVPPLEGSTLGTYQFTLVHSAPLIITYVCSNGDTGTFELPQTLSVNTLRCPSSGLQGILPTYSALPWRKAQDLWRFTGEVANDATGLCSDVYNPPGFLYTWDLTGTDPVVLAPG